MSLSSVKKKNLPKTTKDLSKEQLLEILKKKKQCNDIALRIVEASCEANVTPEWFHTQLININQSHYDDIVTERSIIKYCGYPLCNKPLVNVPNQKYRISLQSKEVYDITERKLFCSGQCFKASNYLKNQLLTSPLWFRDSETLPTFRFMTLGVTEIDKTITEQETELNSEEHSSKKKFSVEKECDNSIKTNELNSIIIEEKFKSEIKSYDPDERNITDPVLKIEKTIEEWFSIRSYLYLIGEERLKFEFKNKKDILKAAFSSQSDFSLNSKKFDDLSKLFSILKLDEEEKKENDLKPLPDYSMLREDAKNLNIKVRAFYTGELEVCTNEVGDTAGSDRGIMSGDIPLVDNQAQAALRRRVLLDQLNKVVPDVCSTLEVEGFFDLSDIRVLVHSFSLSAHNVAFKPREWFLLATVIIKLFSLKIKPLAMKLSSEETKKRILLLLMSYNLNLDFLDNLLDWITDTERLIQTYLA